MEKVTCRFCKKQLDKDSAYCPSPKMYYCNEDHYTKQLNKIKYKPKKTKSNGEPNDRREFTDYVQDIYVKQGYDKHYIPWQMLMSQSSNILKEHKSWTYTTLGYILYYMYEVIELNLFAEDSNGSILSLLPYYGLEAEKYFNQKAEVENAINNYDFNEPIVVKKIKHPTKRIQKISFDN